MESFAALTVTFPLAWASEAVVLFAPALAATEPIVPMLPPADSGRARPGGGTHNAEHSGLIPDRRTSIIFCVLLKQKGGDRTDAPAGLAIGKCSAATNQSNSRCQELTSIQRPTLHPT